jgi:hypothetical protein
MQNAMESVKFEPGSSILVRLFMKRTVHKSALIEVPLIRRTDDVFPLRYSLGKCYCTVNASTWGMSPTEFSLYKYLYTAMSDSTCYRTHTQGAATDCACDITLSTHTYVYTASLHVNSDTDIIYT